MTSHATHASPPGPIAKFGGLQLLRSARKDYLGFVEQLQRQYPDAAQMQILGERITHVFHPDLVREVLVDQADALIRWERATEVFSVSMGQSVLVTEGAQWQRQRRMLQPGFTPKRVAGYAALMAAATRTALDEHSAQTLSKTVDVEALMTRVTLDVILRTLFGQHQVQDAAPIAQAIQTLSHYGFTQFFVPFSWPMWMPLPKVRRANAALSLLNRLISDHIDMQQSTACDYGHDLLTMLRLARDPEQPSQGLSAQDLHDQAMVMFQAGHETTATALTWWCGLMAQHPDIAARTQQEVDTVLQGQDPTPATLAHLPWLQASIKEALRLFPPAAILMTRRACKDITVGPWQLPKSALIALSPYVIQRDARWFENPNEFRPERFLPDAPEIPRGAWMSFGVGPRVCIGQHFAMLEIGLIAAMLLQRFRVSWPQGTTWPAVDLAVSLRPAKAMVLNLEARSKLECAGTESN